MADLPDGRPLFALITQALGQRDWPDLRFVAPDLNEVLVRGATGTRAVSPARARVLASATFVGSQLYAQLAAGDLKVRAREVLPDGRKGPWEELPKEVWREGWWAAERRTGRLHVQIGEGPRRIFVDAVVMPSELTAPPGLPAAEGPREPPPTTPKPPACELPDTDIARAVQTVWNRDGDPAGRHGGVYNFKTDAEKELARIVAERRAEPSKAAASISLSTIKRHLRKLREQKAQEGSKSS
jgi:hypothetical protein